MNQKRIIGFILLVTTAILMSCSSIKPIKPKDSGSVIISEQSTHSKISNLYNDVYYIKTSKIVVRINEKEILFPYVTIGTGFLLSDSSFITARHVVEPWLFYPYDNDMFQVMALGKIGGDITLYFDAYSPSGKVLNFTSKEFSFHKDTADVNTNMDWAKSVTKEAGNLVYDSNLSSSMETATPMIILGYPLGKGYNSLSDISPLYGECKVARDGLDGGLIDIEGRPFTFGNSGGPVLTMVNGKYVVIGIVSSLQQTLGFIVPISSVGK